MKVATASLRGGRLPTGRERLRDAVEVATERRSVEGGLERADGNACATA
jgi:hypothetical protein